LSEDLADRVRERLVKLRTFISGYEAFVQRARLADSVDAFWEELDFARGALAFAHAELDALGIDLVAVEEDPDLAAKLARGTGIESLSSWAGSSRELLAKCERSLLELSAGRPPRGAPRGQA